MMTPAEENATLIFAVIPSVETPDSFLNDKSILDDQNLWLNHILSKHNTMKYLPQLRLLKSVVRQVRPQV